nr:hypothetical protein [Nostoc sp. CreGUA01]
MRGLIPGKRPAWEWGQGLPSSSAGMMPVQIRLSAYTLAVGGEEEGFGFGVLNIHALPNKMFDLKQYMR